MSLSGSVDAGVEFGDGRIVPFGDLAEEDIGEHLAAELELRVHPVGLVDRDDGAKNRWKMQDLAGRGLQLLVGHRTVGRPEEHRLVRQLTDPAAGSHRIGS